MQNKAEFVKVLALLAAAYPRFTLTKETTEVYSQLLADIPVETLKVAALHCATENDFFPSVHELRKSVGEIARKANNIPSAYEAWQDLRKAGRGSWKEAVEYNGQHYIQEHTYEFIHPLVKHVAQLLGWPSEFPGDNPVADRAHFFKAYDQTVNGVLEDETMLPEIRGFIDRQRQGLPAVGKPKEIGAYAREMRAQLANPVTGEVEVME